MADTLTPKVGLTNVEVGASEDTWGDKLNTNNDTLDALFDTGPVLKVAKGGTGAADAATARTNLGLGSMATQNASNVAITGGSVDGLSFVRTSAALPQVIWQDTDGTVGNKNWNALVNDGQFALVMYDDTLTTSGAVFTATRSGNALTQFRISGPLYVNTNLVWHDGNDGPGSGLNADLLDNVESGYFTNASNMASGTLPEARLPTNVLRNTGAFTGGTVTISASAPSGTPAPGDIWLQYV